MTKQKWILLTLCIGILWGTDTLFKSLWEETNSKVANTIQDQQPQYEYNKASNKKKVAKKFARNKPVKLAYNQKGVKAVQQEIAAQSPANKKTKKKDLEKLAKSYDKKLAQKKKAVPTKKKEEDKQQKNNQVTHTDNYNQNQQISRNENDFFSDDDEKINSEGGYSVITPNPNSNEDELTASGGVFSRGTDKTISQWEQALTNDPTDSDVDDFISALRSGDVDQKEAYKLIETLLTSESEKNHSNAVKVIMSIKTEKSFILLTDVVSGGFSESVVSTAYSGLLNYRSYDDLNIIESVLKKDSLSLGAIYFSAETILQLSQQTITTYGEGQNRTVTMLQAYQDRFFSLTALLGEVATGISDNKVLGQVNQTIAYIGGPDAIADSSVVKPSYIF